jgi:thiosulfate reductase cytochrome b subunit
MRLDVSSWMAIGQHLAAEGGFAIGDTAAAIGWATATVPSLTPARVNEELSLVWDKLFWSECSKLAHGCVVPWPRNFGGPEANYRSELRRMTPEQERLSVKPTVFTPSGRPLHPLPIRMMHWINAVAVLIMITSGWGIYDDDVVIRGLHFSQFWRLGEWAAWSLNWHFAGMWLLAINGLTYLIYGLVTGRFRERLLPIRPTEVLQTVVDTLHFKIAHEDITVYNGVQKLLYIVVIFAGIAQVITGIAIWKPIQFSGLVSVLGGFQTARILHFAGMAMIVGFLVVHVALALLVPKTLWAMVAGGPRLRPKAEGNLAE